METVDDFIGEGKPLADRWRELLHREYVSKSDLRKLVDDWRGIAEIHSARDVAHCADELEAVLNKGGE